VQPADGAALSGIFLWRIEHLSATSSSASERATRSTRAKLVQCSNNVPICKPDVDPHNRATYIYSNDSSLGSSHCRANSWANGKSHCFSIRRTNGKSHCRTDCWSDGFTNGKSQ